MHWASARSTQADLADAVVEAAAAVSARLDGATPDLALAFISQEHAAAYDRLPDLLAAGLAPRRMIGCSAGGVIGGGREVERRPGLALIAAVLPGVDVETFALDPRALPAAGAPPAAWEAALGVRASSRPHLVLLPDPFSCDAEGVLRGLDAAYPAATKLGGLASGARAPGGNALYRDAAMRRAGLVGVALAGDVAVDTIVAQGCRPIGEPMFVTGVDGRVIHALDGRRPLDVLQGLVERADARDRRLFGHSLFLGVVMRAQVEYAQGDFLIRNIVGLDGERGALAVAALVEPGAVVQFHLRDAETSADDLEALLARHDRVRRPAGALLFSCLGRGESLYGHADHDSSAFRRRLGDVPLAGFFCNGEIGPVQGVTFLHGYTSSFGLFRSARGG